LPDSTRLRFVERLRQSVKYEQVIPKAYDSIAGARAAIDRYLDLGNRRKPHSRLGARTPGQMYFDHLPHARAT
jgi:putative transposase